MKLRPLGERLVVKRVAAQQRTEGGLYIPEAAQETQQEADVVAVGPRVEDVAAGDRILLGKYSGNEVELDGVPLVILEVEDVLAVVG